MPNWEEIQHEWETTKITLAALAKKHDVPLGTLKSRKSRDKNDGKEWMRGSSKKDATIQRDATEKSARVATESESVSNGEKKNSTSNAKRKRQSNRSGNPNPSHKFPNHNSFQLKHGLYSKFLHKEQVEIIDVMKGSSFVDQLWMQIEIKFSAILRMQKIMGVNNEYDHLDKLSGRSDGMEGSSESYKVVYAHERYESYIRAQTRAMAEYRNLVKQYIELTDEFDERRIKLEGMQANIAKANAEVKKIEEENKQVSPPTINIVDAWSDEE